MGWQAYALGAAFFAALTAILGKIGVSNINSNLATFVRTIVILLITALLISVRKEWQPLHTFDRRSLIFLVLSGVATGASWLFYYRALQIGQASQVAPFEKVSVALTVLLGIFVLGEPYSFRVLCGAGLVVLGAIVIAS
jgi:transporter family protein